MEQTILRLKDGQNCLCSPPDAMALRELLDCVQNPANSGTKRFQLSAPEGRVMDVPGSDIVGVELAPPFVLVRNFLLEPDIERITAHLLEHRDEFTDATISLPTRQGNWVPDYRFRQSRILNDVSVAAPLLMPRLEGLMPRLWERLRMAPMGFNRVECQLAAHGDGGFFKTHTDNGLPDIAHRRVSYVYYFHREPKQFGGGLLRFYTTLFENGASGCGRRWADIEPPRNSLVVFPSHCHHEVTQVSCQSAELADLRLTVNGWFCV